MNKLSNLKILLTNFFTFERIGFLEKLIFTKHLAVMIKAGMPLAEALFALQRQTQNYAFKKLLLNIVTDFTNGQTLTKTLSKHPNVFDPTYLNMIHVGEQSGTLEENLGYLADLLQKRYEFQKKIQSAMLYPILVLTVALIAGGGISLFVLPNLVDLFKSLDVNLPLTTRILLFVSNSLKVYGVFIVGGIFFSFLLCRLLITLPTIKPLWHRILLSLPILGQFLQNIELASICRNMGVMLKSGLSITKTITGQHEATENLVYKAYLYQLLLSVEKGQPISAELVSGKYKYIPPIVASMLAVGEKTGKLDESLIYLGDFFEDDVENTAKNLSNILEPILLIVIGLFVAFMALAIISPIYQITTGIKR